MHARNTGVPATNSDIVLFLDDDAVAAPDWLERITAPCVDPTVQESPAGRHRTGAPRASRDGFQTPFCGSSAAATRALWNKNPTYGTHWVAPWAFVARPLESDIGGFSDTLGRIGTHPVGCEETEFSIRLRNADPSARIVMVPKAVVQHHV